MKNFPCIAIVITSLRSGMVVPVCLLVYISIKHELKYPSFFIWLFVNCCWNRIQSSLQNLLNHFLYRVRFRFGRRSIATRATVLSTGAAWPAEVATARNSSINLPYWNMAISYTEPLAIYFVTGNLWWVHNNCLLAAISNTNEKTTLRRVLRSIVFLTHISRLRLLCTVVLSRECADFNWHTACAAMLKRFRFVFRIWKPVNVVQGLLDLSVSVRREVLLL